MSNTIKVGVISDTHGFLNSEIFNIFKDVDHILHAGDIGTEDILDELRKIAPVTAVQGNGDYFSGWEKYRQVEILHFNGKKLLLTHEADRPPRQQQPMQELISAHAPHAVIYGHSHFSSITEEEGILYINPGCGGRDSYSNDASVVILNIGDKLKAEVLLLDKGKF